MTKVKFNQVLENRNILETIISAKVVKMKANKIITLILNLFIKVKILLIWILEKMKIKMKPKKIFKIVIYISK